MFFLRYLRTCRHFHFLQSAPRFYLPVRLPHFISCQFLQSNLRLYYLVRFDCRLAILLHLISYLYYQRIYLHFRFQHHLHRRFYLWRLPCRRAGLDLHIFRTKSREIYLSCHCHLSNHQRLSRRRLGRSKRSRGSRRSRRSNRRRVNRHHHTFLHMNWPSIHVTSYVRKMLSYQLAILRHRICCQNFPGIFLPFRKAYTVRLLCYHKTSSHQLAPRLSFYKHRKRCRYQLTPRP